MRLLSENGYGDKLVLFNGSNTDPQSKEIYDAWREVNKGTRPNNRLAHRRYACRHWWITSVRRLLS